MKILFIGDIYGRSGRDYLKELLPELRNNYKPNIIIANAENSAHGFGISDKIYKELISQNINLLTLGNHAFDNKTVFNIISDPKTLMIRPANFEESPGKGYHIINYNGKKLLVINIQGRVGLQQGVMNPFLTCDKIIKENPADYIFIDIHAEATSEKIAFAHYFDGRVSAIVGTHTHVQTADERVLPKGTLYLTDVGMTGPYDGVIGVSKKTVIERFIKGYSSFFTPEKGKRQLSAVLLDLITKDIKRIHLHE